MKVKVLSFVPAFIWFIFTIILLTLPASDIPESSFFDLIYFDKWVHIGMFGILTILACWPLIKTPLGTRRLFLLIALSVICYGIIMEFVQKFWTVDRSFDLWDMTADGVGSFLGYFFVQRRSRKILKEKKYN